MTTLPPITERSFLKQVTQLAVTLGWRCYHTQLSKWSEAGWPDLALARPPRLLLVELKSEKGKLTPGQQEWLELLRSCNGVEVHLWRPSDWERITRTLAPVGIRVR